MFRHCVTVVGALVIYALALTAQAHSQSSAYLALETSGNAPQRLLVDVALVDLMYVLDLDRNADNQLTWGEVEDSRAGIFDVVSAGMQLSAGSTACGLADAGQPFSLLEYADVPSLRVPLRVDCPAPLPAAGLVFSYNLFADVNPSHRALLRVNNRGADSVYLLTAASGDLALPLQSSPLAGLAGFVQDGFRHILSGYDHLAFLLLLILPAAGLRGIRTRLLSIGTIVTAFTLAHSITLAAAVTGFVHLPVRPVEIAIAASVVVAGLTNVLRPANHFGWKIAFAFGLLHGFGFAGALAELDLAGRSLGLGLLGFNLGIELGQLAVVALLLPLLVLLSFSARYRSVLVPAASLGCAVVAVFWTIARV